MTVIPHVLCVCIHPDVGAQANCVHMYKKKKAVCTFNELKVIAVMLFLMQTRF